MKLLKTNTKKFIKMLKLSESMGFFITDISFFDIKKFNKFIKDNKDIIILPPKTKYVEYMLYGIKIRKY